MKPSIRHLGLRSFSFQLSSWFSKNRELVLLCRDFLQSMQVNPNALASSKEEQNKKREGYVHTKKKREQLWCHHKDWVWLHDWPLEFSKWSCKRRYGPEGSTCKLMLNGVWQLGLSYWRIHYLSFSGRRIF